MIKLNYKGCIIILLIMVSAIIKSQSAQFVIEYSTFGDAYIADAVIAASYLLKDTKEKISIKEALQIFKDNNIELKFPACSEKNRNTIKKECGTDGKCAEIVESLEECLGRVKLDRLKLSYIFFKALKLKGGLTTRIFGAILKYAYNELAYIGFFKGGFSGQFVTKLEVLNILTNALEYQEKIRRQKDVPKK